MTTQTTAAPSGSHENDSGPYDLDWLKTTKSPVATRTQVAQVFGIDERTVTKGIADGDILAIRVGRRALVPVPALRRLLGIEDGA